MKISLFIALITMLSVQTCNQNTPIKDPAVLYIQLIEASFKKYTSGIKGGKTGREYYIKVNLKEVPVTFDSLWVNNKRLKAIVPQKGGVSSDGVINKVMKPGIVIVRASEIDGLKSQESNRPLNNSSWVGMLRYKANNKEMYLPIETLIEKKLTNRP